MPDPTVEDVRTWTPETRARVARYLDELVDRPAPDSALLRRRQVTLVATALGAVVLLPWIGYLAASLPLASSGGAWRVAWVGFDVVLAVVLMGTAWLGLRRRQVAILGLLVSATMLLTDAWFDVLLSLHTSEQWGAIVSAACIEVPFAVLLGSSAVSILRRSSATVARLRGHVGPTPPFWKQQFLVTPPTPAERDT